MRFYTVTFEVDVRDELEGLDIDKKAAAFLLSQSAEELAKHAKVKQVMLGDAVDFTVGGTT